MATAEKRELRDGTSIQELARNGRRRYEWHLVEGARMLVVRLRFTVWSTRGRQTSSSRRAWR
jgi:hypothetical protein